MGDINLEVWDATGNKRLNVQVPDDVVVERILMVLADKLHLPRYAPDGQLMSYKFHHRRLGVQLLDDQTLVQQHVQDADIVRIQPEITAGAHRIRVTAEWRECRECRECRDPRAGTTD